MKRVISIVIILFVIGSIGVYAQSATLKVDCFVMDAGSDPIITAQAEIYEGNTKIKSVNTDSKGKISFELNYNKNYKIVISKAGMIQKRIDFKTDVAPENQRSLSKEFAMTLVDACDGADVSAFNEPADIITYDAGFGNFVSDKAHFEKMQSKFAQAYRNLDQCKEDNFQEKKSQADQQFNQGNFDEAIKLYEEALLVKPADGVTRRQISAAKKNKEKQEANVQRYEQVIKEADQFLAQNSLSAAQQKYAEAARLNATSTYPQEKLEEIKKIIAQQVAEDQKRQAENDEYNGFVKQGNAAIAAKNYPLAQQMFEKAAAVKPNEALPKQKVAEAQQAMQKLEQQKAENARIEEEYQAAMSAANTAMQQKEFIKAQEHYQAAIALKSSEALPRQKLVEAQKLEAQKQQQLLDAQKAEVEKKYNDAIAEANGFLAQKQYAEAIGAFEKALTIKPSDKYAQQQIVKINNLVVEEAQAKQAAIEQQYNQAIALGDAKKLNKDFPEAIEAYKQALIAKPNDPSAEGKLAEAEKLLADKIQMNKEEQEIRAKYNELVQEGDGLFKALDYSASKTKYQQASELYATEQYPKNQIAKIDNIVAKNKQEAEYNAIIKEADGLFNQKNWGAAKAKYGEAILVIPEKTYPKQRINEINNNISSDAKAAIEKEYNELAAQAEQQVVQKNYEQAKALYAQAMQVMPENPLSQKRINEINQLAINDLQAATDAKYNNLTAQAEEQVTQKNYEQAKSLFAQAQQVLPENPYPQKRINEINQLIINDSKSAVEAEYNNLTAQAEQEVTQKNYEKAKALYAQAQKLIPENTYPQQRINEINQMIDNDAKQGIQNKYNELIAQADGYFEKKEYAQAKSAYSSALQVIPTESYPQQKINEINQLVSNNARQKVTDEYNSAISSGDQFFAQQNYSEATNSYNKALSILPEETYPRQKLNEISAILTEQARLEADKGEVENRYNSIIALSDKYFKDKNYPLAKSEYRKALGIKPGEAYPSQQIDKINQLIADQQQLLAQNQEQERKYKESILKADEEFKIRDYTNAKATYQEALGYKPGDVHASSQISRIDQLIAEKQSAQEKQQQKDAKYNSLIASADNLYSANKLIDSKKDYLSALEVIPGQDYPRSQIRRIDEKLRIIAANKSAIFTTSTKSEAATTTKPATTENNKLDDFSFKSESDRKHYLDELKGKYNKGVTKETYADNTSTTNRYIVIRNGKVNEYRETIYKWGGAQYKVNGKPTNSMYLNSQVKPREGEDYKEVKM